MKEFFAGPLQSQIEIIDDKKIGRVVLGKKSETYHDFSRDNLIGFLFDHPTERNSIARSMHGNSPSLNECPGVGRGVSAYYSWDPKTESLIVEWGEVGPDGEAKLHTYLNRAIDLPRRDKEGMIVRSGHMATSGDVMICLIDSLMEPDQLVLSEKPEYEIVKVLESYGAVVIGTDGYPIRTKSKKGGDLDGRKK